MENPRRVIFRSRGQVNFPENFPGRRPACKFTSEKPTRKAHGEIHPTPWGARRGGAKNQSTQNASYAGNPRSPGQAIHRTTTAMPIQATQNETRTRPYLPTARSQLRSQLGNTPCARPRRVQAKERRNTATICCLTSLSTCHESYFFAWQGRRRQGLDVCRV